jgi:hypothetical protein
MVSHAEDRRHLHSSESLPRDDVEVHDLGVVQRKVLFRILGGPLCAR